MSENIEKIVNNCHKKVVLYLEESGFYEDVEYAKRLGYIEAYVKQINLLNKDTSIRVLIMTRDSRLLIRIFAENYATRNLDIVSLLGRHSSIRNEKNTSIGIFCGGIHYVGK